MYLLHTWFLDVIHNEDALARMCTIIVEHLKHQLKNISSNLAQTYRECMLLFGGTIAFLDNPPSYSSLPNRISTPRHFVKPV